MAKLFLLSATLALFLLLVNANTYRTIVEFDEDTDLLNRMGPQQQGKCQREFHQQQRLRGCQNWIRRRAQQGRIGYEETADEEIELTFDHLELENPVPGQQRTSLRRCCNELRQVDRMCVCPTLKQATQQAGFMERHRPQQVQHMFRVAKNLPNICNIHAVGSCPFYPQTPY